MAVEATGVYWIPLFKLLVAPGPAICLVNAQHVRHLPGDVQNQHEWWRAV